MADDEEAAEHEVVEDGGWLAADEEEGSEGLLFEFGGEDGGHVDSGGEAKGGHRGDDPECSEAAGVFEGIGFEEASLNEDTGERSEDQEGEEGGEDRTVSPTAKAARRKLEFSPDVGIIPATLRGSGDGATEGEGEIGEWESL